MIPVAEVCLLTADVPRLAPFYRALLQLAPDPTQADDPVHQTLIAEPTMLTVHHDPQLHPGAGQTIALAFTVPDVDASHRELVERGIPIVQPPTSQPWGARNLVIRDPDSNLVYLRTLPTR